MLQVSCCEKNRWSPAVANKLSVSDTLFFSFFPPLYRYLYIATLTKISLGCIVRFYIDSDHFFNLLTPSIILGAKFAI